MAYQAGLSFQPGTQQNGGATGDRPGRVTPVQQAIRLLSLRLPSVVGARAIAPQALLQSPGSAGLNTGAMTLEAFLRRLMMQSGAAAPPQADDVFTVPSAQEDRERGVSRELPRPGGARPGRPVPESGPAPSPAPPPLPPTPSVRPGDTPLPRDPVPDPGTQPRDVLGDSPMIDFRGPRNYR